MHKIHNLPPSQLEQRDQIILASVFPTHLRRAFQRIYALPLAPCPLL